MRRHHRLLYNHYICPSCGNPMLWLTSIPPKGKDGKPDLFGNPTAHVYGCAPCGSRLIKKVAKETS